MAQSGSPRINDYWQSGPQRKADILRLLDNPSRGVRRLVKAAEDARRVEQQQTTKEDKD